MRKSDLKKLSNTTIFIGDTIEFNSIRVMNGNPVSGVITAMSDTAVEIRLLKTVETIFNIWDKGDTKYFRYSLINGGIKKL